MPPQSFELSQILKFIKTAIFLYFNIILSKNTKTAKGGSDPPFAVFKFLFREYEIWHPEETAMNKGQKKRLSFPKVLDESPLQ